MPYIYKEKQAIVFRLKDPKRVTSYVPGAKAFFGKDGVEYVAVPHRPRQMRYLNDLSMMDGIPDSMDTYYEYPGKFKPFDVQRKTASFATMHSRLYILNSMGLGKTITSLWAIDYLRQCGEVHSVLVVCPISVMERTWADEIFRAFPSWKVNVLYGTAERRKKLLADKADVYIVNTDGQKIIADELADRKDIDLVVIDEVALFRNSRSARWKSMNEICNKQLKGSRRVWGLTGSPIPNSPEDAYGLMKLVTPKGPSTPKSFKDWRERTMINTSMYVWTPKPYADKIVFDSLKPSIRFALDDAIDLPPQTIVDRKVPMSPEQKRAFDQMRRELFMEVESGSVTAANEAVKASKLLQIGCGVAYGENHKELPVDATKRLEALDEVVCEAEGKTIVFVPFSSALNSVKEYLEKQGHTVAVVQGDTTKQERDEIFHDFQYGENPKVIVANPTTMSHGLTLTAATAIVWFGPTYSNEVYQQACARVRRPGQKRTTVIVHLISSKFEDMVYQKLRSKQKIQGSLLDMVNTNSVETY